MSTQPHQGGRRPIDRILAPGFAEDVADLGFEELRARRHLAEQEEVDLSYARRLLQGRLELLTAQLLHAGVGVRAGDRSDADLVHDLAGVLSDGPARADHGLGRHLNVDPSRVGEHRRAAEQAVADLASEASEDPEVLAAAVARITELEHAVSENRHRVQQVMDVLTAEVARRYRTGQARVEDVLPHE